MQPPMIGRECCIKNWSRSSLWWPGHGPQQKISSVICLSDQGNQHLEGSFLIFLVLTNINCTNLFLNKCEYNLLIHSLRMEKCVFLCETCVAAHWGSTPHHPVFQKHDLLQSNQEILRIIWKKKTFKKEPTWSIPHRLNNIPRPKGATSVPRLCLLWSAVTFARRDASSSRSVEVSFASIQDFWQVMVGTQNQSRPRISHMERYINKSQSCGPPKWPVHLFFRWLKENRKKSPAKWFHHVPPEFSISKLIKLSFSTSFSPACSLLAIKLLKSWWLSQCCPKGDEAEKPKRSYLKYTLSIGWSSFLQHLTFNSHALLVSSNLLVARFFTSSSLLGKSLKAQFFVAQTWRPRISCTCCDSPSVLISRLCLSARTLGCVRQPPLVKMKPKWMIPL